MKCATTILVLIGLALSCQDNKKSASYKNQQIVRKDSSANTQVDKDQPIIHLIYETENIKLYGDATIDKDKISYGSIKFEPYIGFSDFKVNSIDHKKYVDLNFSSNTDANSFRTRLREAYSVDTANFAGHYTFVYWGCGTSCQSSLLIDRKTGKIYNSPGASLGYDFKVDSRMLIVNPPDANGFYDDCFYCKPRIYIFDEQTKTFTERQLR